MKRLQILLIICFVGSQRPEKHWNFFMGGFFGTTYRANTKERLVCLIMTQQIPDTHGDVVQKFEAMVYASLQQK